MLGKDPITVEKRYEPEYTILPYCAVILVSNFLPESIGLFSKEGIHNKINLIVLKKENKVQPHERIPDFHAHCLQYAAEIANWALYTPLHLHAPKASRTEGE